MRLVGVHGPGGSTGATASKLATTAAGAPSAAKPGTAATESNPAGDIPDNQAFVAYSPAAGGFTVKVPEGWARRPPPPERCSRDKYNSVQIVASPAATAPTVASVTSTDIPVSRGSQRASPRRRSRPPSARPARPSCSTYQADSAPNPVTGKVAVEAVERYTFWRNGTAVVLTLSAPVGSDNVDPWRRP